MLRKGTGALCLPAIMLLAWCMPMFGHHGSNPNYRWDKTITVNGVVTEFSFAYPHVSLFFDVKGEKGDLEHWSSELGPTPIMMRNWGVGWTRNSIKAGDQITLTCNPTKVPSKTCQGKKLTVNGKEMPLRDPKGGEEEGQGKQ